MIKVLLNLLFQKLFNHENITMIQKLKYSSIVFYTYILISINKILINLLWNIFLIESLAFL